MAHDNFNRMEGDRSINWDMKELDEFSGDSLSSEKIRSTVRKSCNVGKKLLITGLAISSAPVVLPPLVIMSAFGFVASIPYGVFLASYACTETIMSVWLPMPGLLLKPYRADEEMVDESGYEEDLDEDNEDHVMETTKRDEVFDDLDHIDAVVVQGDIEDETDFGSGERDTFIEVTTVEFEGNGDIGDEEEELNETKGLLKRIRDEGRRENDFSEANAAADCVRGIEILTGVNEPSDSVEESFVGLLNEADSASVHPHAEYGTSEVITVSSRPTSEEAELHSLTIIDVIESAEELSVSAVTIEPKIEANIPHEDYKVPSNEELSSEVKMRETIDSMKKIVGYKASTGLGTYIDEVNALYAFVGVEPPSPLKGSSDGDDVNLLDQKLQFLMSIVGVK